MYRTEAIGVSAQIRRKSRVSLHASCGPKDVHYFFNFVAIDNMGLSLRYIDIDSFAFGPGSGVSLRDRAKQPNYVPLSQGYVSNWNDIHC